MFFITKFEFAIIKLNYYNIKLEDIVETWKDIKEIYSIYLNLIAW